MPNGTISFLQASMILMLMCGLASHVIVNPMMLDVAGRDAWISVLLTSILFLPWCLILLLIMKKSRQQKLQPWLAQQTTPFLSWVILAPVLVILYLIGGMTIVHTTVWTITNYLPASPKFILITALVLVCQYPARVSIRAIAITSGILLPTVVTLGIFVSVANSTQKNYAMLKPFLENGWQPAFNGIMYAAGGLVELFVVVLMQHHLKTKASWWKLLLLASMLVYITVGPLIGAITEFGPHEAAKQMISPYEQWRLVRLGDYVEHVDFLSVFQWLSGASIRISLSLFLLADILPMRSTKSRNWLILLVSLSYIVLAMLPINQDAFYLWMFQDYFPPCLYTILIVTGIWMAVALMTKPPKEKVS